MAKQMPPFSYLCLQAASLSTGARVGGAGVGRAIGSWTCGLPEGPCCVDRETMEDWADHLLWLFALGADGRLWSQRQSDGSWAQAGRRVAV
jgi:hypothetical protein